MVDQVLEQLERVAAVQAKRPLGISGKPRKPFSLETKRRMAAAQKRRWAAYHKAKAAKN